MFLRKEKESPDVGESDRFDVLPQCGGISPHLRRGIGLNCKGVMGGIVKVQSGIDTEPKETVLQSRRENPFKPNFFGLIADFGRRGGGLALSASAPSHQRLTDRRSWMTGSRSESRHSRQRS